MHCSCLSDTQWVTVYHYPNYHWDINDAKVACRQLGFTKSVGFWWYGRGTGKVWLTNMGCSGSSLRSCSHGGWGNVLSDCSSHTYDVRLLLYIFYRWSVMSDG